MKKTILTMLLIANTLAYTIENTAQLDNAVNSIYATDKNPVYTLFKNSQNSPQATNTNSVQKAFNTSRNTANFKTCYSANNTICKIRIRERMSAVIQLPADDAIDNWVLGDDINFNFGILSGDKKTAFIRGVHPGNDTNLNIIGKSGNIYSFYVRTDSFLSKYLPDFIVKIKPSISISDLQNIVAKNTKINFKITSGELTLIPIEAFEDGASTYFKFVSNLPKLPTIYKIKDGFVLTTKAQFKNNYLIVDTTSNSWKINLDKAQAYISKVLPQVKSESASSYTLSTDIITIPIVK